MKRAFLFFLLGTAVFAALFRFTPAGFILSSVAGIASMFLAGFLSSRIRGEKKTSGAQAPSGRSYDETAAAETAVKEGMDKLRAISNSARIIEKNDVAAAIREICRIGVDIFDHIRKNPQDLGKARQFTLYYIDATHNIVHQYVELQSKKEKTAEMQQAMAKVESMLGEIKGTYTKQLSSLYEHSLLDLNAELTLLKKTMEMEK